MPTILKIALPGFDVAEASPEQCAIHSDYSAPKIDSAKEHFVNINVDFINEPPGPGSTDSTTTTILYQNPHEYTYTPQLWLHVEYTLQAGGSSFNFGPGTAFLGAVGAGDATYLKAYADTENYYVAIEKNTGPLNTNVISVAGTFLNVRLYILAEGVLDE